MEVVQAMTSITPSINVPIRPGPARDPRAAVATSNDAEPGFEMLVAPSGDLPGDAASAGSARADEAALRSAIAHVFNAYGFFSTDAGETTDTGVSQATASTAGDEIDVGETDSPEPQPPVADGSHPTPPDFSLPPQASARAVAVHAGSLPPGPAGKGHATDSQPVDPFLRALENRLANAPELPEQASTRATAKREAHAEQRDRVTLKIAEHSADLIARLSNLSDEEKQRLFDEIDSLLAAHGLSLASATLNGEPFSQAARSKA